MRTEGIVKICGVRTIEHALAAAQAGADMIGLVFAPSRRQISPEQAAQIASDLRASGVAVPLLVGLFVNAAPEEIARTAQLCGLDLIQLSGDERPDVLAQLPPLPVLKSLRLADDHGEAAWLDLSPEYFTPLVDAHVPGSYGGTGAMANWQRAATLARIRPIMLAGGLSPANVAQAIALVQPWAVDVSSGVEQDGQKSSELIRSFVSNARQAAWQAQP
ncbi:phosphoribosylanthranilate isomerase [Chloroflexia bacterium SDU3-3]|nr:phosphoribosylanthranilate isomerase [Chloroflexia bacterium SDU3-3]